MSSNIEVRPATQQEMVFVKSSWLDSYFSNFSKFTENLSRKVYRRFHPKIIEGILARSLTEVLGAYPKEDPELLAGYIVFEAPNTIHFIYVKYNFRKFGIGKALFTHSKMPADFQYTHRTKDANWIVGYEYSGKREVGKFPDAVYNPYCV